MVPSNPGLKTQLIFQGFNEGHLKSHLILICKHLNKMRVGSGEENEMGRGQKEKKGQGGGEKEGG